MKKVLSLLVVAVMLFALCIPLSAADPLVFSANDITIAPGETDTVSIEISDNPGVAGITLQTQFDSATTKALFTVGAAKTGDFGAITKGNNPKGFRWVLAVEENIVDDGTFVSFDVTAKSDTPAGVYKVYVTVPECFDDGIVDDVPTGNFQDVEYSLGGLHKEGSKYYFTISVEAAAPAITVDDFTAGMSATVAADVTANLVIDIPEGADLDKLSVAVDGAAATLPAVVNGQIKLPTAKKAAKNLAEQITYTITYDGASKEITTSLADYAAALVAGTDAAAAAVGQAMLNYGAAAKAEFGNANTPAIKNGVADAAPAIVFDRFDATALNVALRAPESTVSYTALTATYETEITLSMALRVNDNYKNNVDAAAQWVADNFKIDGKDVAVSTKVGGGYTFIVITVAGIAVDDVKTPMAITVAGADAGTVCVANYLASVEAAYANNPAKAGQLNVARALFAYATALNAIA